MKKPVLFFLTVASAFSWRGDLLAASFDCQKAKASVEKIICGDEKLSSLDEQMDLRFTQALGGAADREGLLKAQKEWIEERNACESAKCVKKVYDRRLQELQKASPKVAVSPAPSDGQIRTMLSKNYGLSAFASNKKDGDPCLLKDCGRAGPFPDITSVCNHLKSRFAKDIPNGTFNTCRVKKFRAESDDSRTQPVSFKNPEADGILNAFVFSIEVYADCNCSVPFLALQTRRGWWLVDELAQVNMGGSMGISGGFEIERAEFLQLIPKGPHELALTFGRSQSDYDLGLGAQSGFGHDSLILCKDEAGTPACSPKIPLAIFAWRELTDAESDEELRRRKEEQKDALYRHETRIRRAFDPEKGTITLSLQKGKLPPELAPFMGTFKLEDLLAWQKAPNPRRSKGTL